MARGFANGVFRGGLWDVLLWLWTSLKTANFRQVAQHDGVWAFRAGKPRTDGPA